MSSSSLFSRPSTVGMQRRPVAAQPDASNQMPSSAVIHPDIDPPPKPRALTQCLAVGFFIFLVLLQFLPVTHVRDPSGPRGNWLPSDSNLRYKSVSSPSKVSSPAGGKGDMIHIVSWMDCLDLQVLAVLANFTLSNSRYPDKVYFHFFVPSGHDVKFYYYKLKVLFPHSNLEVLEQKEVKEILETVTSQGEYGVPSFHEMAPFIIPIAYPSISRFIYVSPDIIVKGTIEELYVVDLDMYGAAAADDCTKNLSAYVKFDVLDAIQRSASNPWVSKEPYERSACVPDLDVILIDSRTSNIDMIEAILWWSGILNIGSERFDTNPSPNSELS
ncbi:uncharacterized protein LOC122061161 [Macadamia integrifolia]|uniref:uncharacterized protein LOC122061161 n=1 Tax=Macadamia integrifolia TaxID=60698 RepID=UPI001C528686|nr:uncharacterized protein LOC122061161 [Macadamia integrifolia]